MFNGVFAKVRIVKSKPKCKRPRSTALHFFTINIEFPYRSIAKNCIKQNISSKKCIRNILTR